MTFSVSTVARSLADYLAPLLPGVEFVEDPAQQGANPPCLFLQQRYSRIRPETGGFWRREIGLDLTYLEDYNQTDLQQRYLRAAEILDLALETFPYQEGGEKAPLRAYERKWSVDQDALHYKFEIRPRVSVPAGDTKMETMEYNQEAANGE